MLVSVCRAAGPLHGMSAPLRRASGEAGKWKKRNVALTISYLGTRFHGLQYWPTSSPEPYEAVENVVEGAAYRAGCISKENFHTPSKFGLMRACRTDRGVHAARNVLRMKLLVPPTAFDEHGYSASLCNLLNAHLPPDIRVHGVNKVSKTFQPRTATQFRVYDYLLPADPLREAGVDVQVLNTCLGHFTGRHNFANFTRLRGRDYLSAAEIEEQREQWAHERAGTGVEEGSASPSSGEGEGEGEGDGVARVLEASLERQDPSDPDRFQVRWPETGEPLPASVAKDASLSRNVYACAVEEEARDVEGVGVHRVRVMGSGFMYHQIRKMVGGALAVAVGGMTETALRCALAPGGPRVYVPKAPPHPLALAGLSLVEEQGSLQRPQARQGPLRMAPWGHVLPMPETAHARIAQWTQDVLYPHVAHQAALGEGGETMRAFLASVKEGAPWDEATEARLADVVATADRAREEAERERVAGLEAIMARDHSLAGAKRSQLVGPEFATALTVRLGVEPGEEVAALKDAVATSVRHGLVPFQWPQERLLDWVQTTGPEAVRETAEALAASQ